MLPNECAATKVGWEKRPVVKDKTERSRMIAEGVVRCNGRGDKVGALWLDSRVDVLAVIAIRKTIERPIFYCSHVVGDKVVAKIVPLIDRGPQCAALRLPSEPVGVAQSG